MTVLCFFHQTRSGSSHPYPSLSSLLSSEIQLLHISHYPIVSARLQPSFPKTLLPPSSCLLSAFHSSPLSYEHLSMPIYHPSLKMVVKLLPQTSVLFLLVFSFQLQWNTFLSKLGFFITYVFLPPSHHSSHCDSTSAPSLCLCFLILLQQLTILVNGFGQTFIIIL